MSVRCWLGDVYGLFSDGAQVERGPPLRVENWQGGRIDAAFFRRSGFPLRSVVNI